jgi:hypothetical protein
MVELNKARIHRIVSSLCHLWEILENSSNCVTINVPRTECSPLQGFSAGYSGIQNRKKLKNKMHQLAVLM